ncbi:MAG: 2-phosphosulfolactate phosphatase family protein [Bacteroidales bacterium]|nr:2-phosphosulfolactate phosphatase family protein [Bacteroidales bacterium]
MKIDVYLRHQDVNSQDLENCNVVVIDVLRATSVIATALYNGALSVQTVAEVHQAFAIQKQNADVLLAGERNTVKVAGFHFGNSPLEMIPVAVKGRKLVMSTSNGSKAVAVAELAKSLRTVAFVNMNAVVSDLLELNEDFVIICSGTNGNFSLDDGLAAGMLINRIQAKKEVEINDSGLAMSLIIKDESMLTTNLKDCYHLKLLQKRNFQEDIDYCLSTDIIDVVPKFMNGKFVL